MQLNGTVDSERTKQRATELARQVEGVRRVVNNLKVQGYGPAYRRKRRKEEEEALDGNACGFENSEGLPKA